MVVSRAGATGYNLTMDARFVWNDIPRAHAIMHVNKHKPGNMAVLVQAKRPGPRTFEDVVEG